MDIDERFANDPELSARFKAWIAGGKQGPFFFQTEEERREQRIAKRKAALKQYQQSVLGKLTQKTYHQSDKGKLALRAAQQRYRAKLKLERAELLALRAKGT